jgi:hypothetical protein
MKKEKNQKSYFDTFKLTSKESETIFFFVLTQSQKSLLAYTAHTLAKIKCTDNKENLIFLIHKEIQSGAVAKSYMRKPFLINEEMRKYFPIYEEAVSHCNCSIPNFLIYEEN